MLEANLPPRYDILGLGVDNLALTEAVDLIQVWVEKHQHSPDEAGKMVITANPEYVMAARRDSIFRQIVAHAALRTADGAGLIACGRLWGLPFNGRVTGVALTHALAQRSAALAAQNKTLSLFLLGAKPGVAQAAAERLQTLYPGVQIAGTFAGEAIPDSDADTTAQVRASQPDIVLVAYGMGTLKQDGWMFRNLDSTGAAVAIGVGGVFDYLTGQVSLAPSILRNLGLEWAYRLYREPWRWRRMLALPLFAALVLARVPARRLKPIFKAGSPLS